MHAGRGGTLWTNDKNSFPPLEGKLNLSKDAVSEALIVIFASSPPIPRPRCVFLFLIFNGCVFIFFTSFCPLFLHVFFTVALIEI